jgi:transmembrane sensor
LDMNTQTSLSVLRHAENSGVRLIQGEAIIETHDTPFLVQAGSSHVVTRQAQFDIRAEKSEVCVTCMTGTLRLLHPRKTVSLAAGDQITYTDRNIGNIFSTDTAIVTAWRHGMLIFHNAPLGRVIAEVNRYRKGRVVLLNDELARRPVYASFHLGKLDTVVDYIQRFSGARVFSVGQVVFLS